MSDGVAGNTPVAPEPVDDVDVMVDYAPSVNYAMQQNDVPLIRRVVVRNRAGHELRNLRLTLSTEPAVIESQHRVIEALDLGGEVELGDIRPLLLRGPLRALTEREVGHLLVELSCDGRTLVSRRNRLALLAFNEWEAHAQLPELLAAFVLPNDPAVGVILGKARDVLAVNGNAALSGYQDEDPARVWTVAAAIWEAIASTSITYATPPASFEGRGQKIRTPSQIVESRFGTCMDLTVLFAACIEQAGLNPVVALFNGHAYPGLWLKAGRFSEPSTTHSSDLRNRVDLNEIAVFEATAVCGGSTSSFKDALSIAKARLAPEREKDFDRAIDVAMARKAGIRPIPLSQSDEPDRPSISGGNVMAGTLPTPPPELNVPSLSDPRPAPAEGPESAPQRLKRWKDRLLDLSLRNRLLNFKDSKKTIPLLCSNSAALEDALANGLEFRVLPAPAVMGDTDPRDAQAHRERTGTDALAEFLNAEMAARRLHASLPEEDLQARLIDLYRAARVAFEEGGANVLYLAIGFLRWFDSGTPAQSSKPLKAPLILLPVRLERASVRDGFRLRILDEETRINVTLLKRLEEQDIVIPGLNPPPEDEAGFDVPLILNLFREAVKNVPRWTVLDEVALCTLTFSKFLMWLDLEKNAAQLTENSVVRHLVHTPNEPFYDQRAFPDEASLDRAHAPSSTFCPVDADSSQLAAIFAAAEGRSFVLQGPPGTGKSQTIVNLVSQTLALGKRVLFVSEKMAALDVVKKRLGAVGLDPFCLELHSTKASKDSVRKQLQASAALTQGKSPAEWEAEASRLSVLRDQLNAYVIALHEEGPFGRSAFWALSILVRDREVPEIALRPTGHTLDRARFDQMSAAVRQLQRSALDVRPGRSHPLRFVRLTSWRVDTPDQVTAEAVRVKERVALISAAATAALPQLGLSPQGPSMRDILLAGRVFSTLEDTTSPPEAMLNTPAWTALEAKIKGWVERGRKRDTERTALLEVCTSEVLSCDHALYLDRIARYKSAPWWRRLFGARRLKADTAFLVQAPPAASIDDIERHLRRARRVNEETARLSAIVGEERDTFKTYWRDGEGDWAAIERDLVCANGLRALIEAERPVSSLPGVRERWIQLATTGAKDIRQNGPIHATGRALRDSLIGIDTATDRLRSQLDLSDGFKPPLDESSYLDTLTKRVDEILSSLPRLRLWASWMAAAADIGKFELAPLAAAIADGSLAPELAERAFEKGLARWFYGLRCASYPVLASFLGRDQMARIQEFRQADERFRDLTSAVVRSQLAARVPRDIGTLSNVQTSETGKLQRFIQGGRTTVRRLFQDCPNVLALHKPCVLMSPLSVAQYLGPGFPKFDLVVFDEASQMPVWEAVGAIARGKELVVVGDSKQLPPTSFFDYTAGTEEVQDDELVDEESILDECAAAQLPSLTLKWHYRSQHESLIAFSNARYYEGKLLTFPSVEAVVPSMGVRWVEVPDGVYEMGSAINRVEAQRVVDDILRRLDDPAERNRSLGVVTFSRAQQKVIEDLLEKERDRRPDLDALFSRQDEPHIVKNLETVQGDERDVILFSICYGPDAAGRVNLRFGPLIAKGGQRRLNVAITRARQEVVVFSRLRPDQIDLSRTSAAGVADLKLFLDYARRGPAALGAAAVAGFASCESPFEQAVFDALTARRWTLHKQIGCSSYRIDLAVVDPERPGRYLLGIECDGANYHSAKTARDRDRLRAHVLTRLGWRLERVWSTDWWLDAETEIERLDRAISDAAAKRPVPAPPVLGAPAKFETPQREAAVAPAPARLDREMPLVAAFAGGSTAPAVKQPPAGASSSARRTYVMADYQPQRYQTPEDFYAEHADAAIRRVTLGVVATEGPINLTLLARRVGASWGLLRATDRVQRRILGILKGSGVQLRRAGSRTFVWPKEAASGTLSTFRIPDSEDSTRTAEEICPEEVVVVIRELLAKHISIGVDDLLREVARQFGIQRLGGNVREFLAEGLSLASTRGAVTLDGDIVKEAHLPQSQE